MGRVKMKKVTQNEEWVIDSGRGEEDEEEVGTVLL